MQTANTHFLAVVGHLCPKQTPECYLGLVSRIILHHFLSYILKDVLCPQLKTTITHVLSRLTKLVYYSPAEFGRILGGPGTCFNFFVDSGSAYIILEKYE